MYFNYRGFLKALKLALAKRPFSLRHLFYVLFFSILFLSFVLLVALGRLLDHLLFPEFKKVKIERPVFIIAPPRSGTSFLQKVLCQDEQRFVHWKMYQTIFPCIVFQKIFDVLAKFDSVMGNPLQRLSGWCSKKWFGGWDDMHRMRFDQPEEDQALFLYAFASEAIFMLFPFVDQLWEVGFPDALPAEDRKKLMAYYRSCMQRHLYASGGGRIILTKSTHASGSIESISEEFKDARFITIVRHPYESIASHVSLFVPAWQAHSPEINRAGPESREYAGLAIAWYKHLYQFRSKVAPESFYSIDYRDLHKNPEQVIEKVYRHFGWTISESYRSYLKEISNRQHTYKSKHNYSLEEFGLSRQWIQTELGPILETYDLGQ